MGFAGEFEQTRGRHFARNDSVDFAVIGLASTLRARCETIGGNRKIERCIRTIIELLRAKKQIVHEKDNTGLSDILFHLRTARGQNAQFPAAVQMGRQYTIIGDLLKSSSTCISEDQPNFQLELNEYPHDADSTILVRERVVGAS